MGRIRAVALAVLVDAVVETRMSVDSAARSNLVLAPHGAGGPHDDPY